MLPECDGLIIEKSVVLSERVLVVLNSTKPSAYCPLCNSRSSRVHSRYTRTLTDLPWGELQVRLLLKVRRFFCPNSACPRQTFAERLGQEIAAYARPARRGSKLDPYLPYLQKRWQEGCHSAVALYKEIREQGFEGARSLVSNYLSQLRAQLPGALAQRRQREAPVTTAISLLAEKKLNPRQAAWLFVKAPSELKESQLEKVRELCESSEDLAETYHLAQAFREMVKGRQNEGLAQWLEQAKASRVKGWKGFAHGIVRDLEAVKAGLSLEWSNERPAYCTSCA